jgi:hypothetical protein
VHLPENRLVEMVEMFVGAEDPVDVGDVAFDRRRKVGPLLMTTEEGVDQKS